LIEVTPHHQKTEVVQKRECLSLSVVGVISERRPFKRLLEHNPLFDSGSIELNCVFFMRLETGFNSVGLIESRRDQMSGGRFNERSV
jgi:hypothetical protein